MGDNSVDDSLYSAQRNKRVKSEYSSMKYILTGMLVVSLSIPVIIFGLLIKGLMEIFNEGESKK
jgi:hypothetical protein